MVSGRNLAIVAVIIVLAIFAYDLATKKERKAHPIETIIQKDRSSWITYESSDGLFAITLPSAPQHVGEVALLPNGEQKVKYDVYFSQGIAGATCVISTIRYPAAFDITRQEEVLEGVKKEMMGSNPSNQILSDEKSTFMGFPSVEFSIKNNGFTSKTKAILASTVLYIITVMERNPEQLDADFTALVHSFVIKNPQST